jgi:hypothetical protein
MISVELSTTFIHMHKACAEKNILLPYPITDGRYFNGEWSRQAAALLVTNSTASNSLAVANANEISIPDDPRQRPHPNRPLSVFYRAGLHGSCTMFDAVLAGCIPVILSHDFVWRLSDEIEPITNYMGNTHTTNTLRQSDFSIRWPAQEYEERKYDQTCQLSNVSDISLFERLEKVPMDEIERLRKG